MLKNNTFSTAPVTNYHKLGGWKQHKLSLLLGVWHPSPWADIKVLNGEILIFKNKINHYLFNLAAPGLSCSMQTLSWGMWDLIPRPGMEPGPPVLGAWSLSHWTTREVLRILLLAFSGFQRLLHSLAHDPSPSSQPTRANWILSSLHSDFVCLPLPHFGTLVITLGPPGSPKIIFLLEGQQNSKLNSICNLISLLPCDETLAQNLGVRMRASLGSHHSTYHMVRSTVEKNRARMRKREGPLFHCHVNLWPQLKRFCFSFKDSFDHIERTCIIQALLPISRSTTLIMKHEDPFITYGNMFIGSKD